MEIETDLKKYTEPLKQIENAGNLYKTEMCPVTPLLSF